MNDPLPYLPWAWPKNASLPKQHYFPASGGGTLCGLWIEPGADRDGFPVRPCQRCRDSLARAVARAVGAAT